MVAATSASGADREADVMSAALASSTTEPPSREPIRLRLNPTAGRDHLDGGWWPYSHDLAAELPDLVRHLPPSMGLVTRALYSRPDWEKAPRRIPLPGRMLKVGSFPHDDTHVLVVHTTTGKRITLLVVPPSFTAGQGAEALLASASPGNTHPAREVLREVTDQHDADPADVWARDVADRQQPPRSGGE